jgi:predicted secreted hydrolase
MWKWAALALVSVAIVIAGFSLAETGGGGESTSSALLAGGPADTSGFARAFEPLDWAFPRNFGPHPEYQTEWWYYTGNLADEQGQRYGFQFTVFRRGLNGQEAAADSSDWRASDLYMAHFTLSDIAGGQFFHEERFSRGGAELAGATVDPVYRVWLEDWQVVAENADATETRITAAGDGFGVDLALTQVKPPALQGDQGLSAKSAEPGNASHYYSLSRLLTEGTLTIGERTFSVEGASWKDHEFSTSALGPTALGWDWFGLQLDDNRELMVGQIRQIDGGKDPYFGGLLIEADGSTRYLPADSFTIEATGTWDSPHTGATYPSGWVITLDIGAAAPLVLTVTPLMPDQELHGGGIAYWEGAVRISGGATGYGYAELTGYADSMTGRF